MKNFKSVLSFYVASVVVALLVFSDFLTNKIERNICYTWCLWQWKMANDLSSLLSQIVLLIRV